MRDDSIPADLARADLVEMIAQAMGIANGVADWRCFIPHAAIAVIIIDAGYILTPKVTP